MGRRRIVVGRVVGRIVVDRMSLRTRERSSWRFANDVDPPVDQPLYSLP
jgi:hypothetical protein